MTRPSRLIRAAPRPAAGALEYDNDLSGLDATTVQEAIDELLEMIEDGPLSTSGYPRPLMAQDPDDDHWYVVVDGDGTAVMVTG